MKDLDIEGKLESVDTLRESEPKEILKHICLYSS